MDIGDIKYLVKAKNLSNAIRIGAAKSLSSREHNRTIWVQQEGERCFACVIGAAWIGSGGAMNIEDRATKINPEWVSRNFAIPREIVDTFHMMYENKGFTREQIADWLESQGY